MGVFEMIVVVVVIGAISSTIQVALKHRTTATGGRLASTPSACATR